MNIDEYRQLAQAAHSRAESASTELDKLMIQVETAGRIPRFPSLAPLHVGLLLPAVEGGAAAVPVAEAAVSLVRTALLVGARDLAEEVTSQLESMAGEIGEARISGLASLARSMLLVTEGRAPGARAELEKAHEYCEEERDRVLLDVVEVALFLTERNEEEAERKARAFLQSLDDAPEWDGERYDGLQKLAFLFMNQDRVEEAVETLEEARDLATGHGLPTDAGTCLVSLVPMFILVGRTERALELMDEALSQLAALEGTREIEMALRGLQMQAMESRGELADALRAGFAAIERAKDHGTIDDYTGFVVHMAAMYQAGGSPLDAYHVLALAEAGLAERGDCAMQVSSVRQALEALRTDLGDREFERIVEQAQGLDPVPEGRGENRN